MLKHDAYVVTGTGRRLHFPVVLRPEGAGLTGDVTWQSWGNFGRMIGVRCRGANAFVAISTSIEDELHEAWSTGTMRAPRFLGMDKLESEKPRIVSIPNGVPLPPMPWQPRGEWWLNTRAVFVGRLAPEKGLGTLIDAWPFVLARYPTAQLVLLGDGPERAALVDRARSLQLTVGTGQSIDLPGALADPSQILRTGDLFVLASREEGMSVALLESMSLGITLVASSIPGNRRLIRDFEHGRLVPPDNARAFAQAIIDQWSNSDRAFQMGRMARIRVEKEFSIDQVARKHLELFHEILQKRTANGGY
jgi:glycosyltransferase involved in cell wall biosynthesis